MSGRLSWEPVAAAFRGEQLKPTVILLVAPLLMVTWWYFGDPKYLANALPDAFVLWANRGASGAVYSFAAAFVLFGVIPALVVRFAFREKLADYGVRLGDPARTRRSILVLCPFFLLVAYVASRDPSVQAYYPINPGACISPGMFVIHAASYFLFYLGWEFHFRGFVQIGLRQRLGDVNALLVQVLCSGILHLGRPVSETYTSFIAGLLWGVLAYRTRSLLSGLAQHALLGIALDYFLCHHR
jgi:uncharacterized protein